MMYPLFTDGPRPVATIISIGIADGARRAKVVDPRTGEFAYHGLGVVGELLMPYLGTRSEGYDIALPDDGRDLKVFIVDWEAPPRANGRQPIRHVTTAALGAADYQPEEVVR